MTMRASRFIVAAVAVFAGSSAAQSTGRPLTIEDYYRVLDVGGPQMSPDGRMVAFTVSRRIEATNGDSSEVWLTSSGGGITMTRVSSAGSHATNPQWNADGKLRFNSGGRAWIYDPATSNRTDGGPVAAGSGRGGRAGGGGEIRLTSPDGRWSAVVRAVPPP